MVSRSTILPLFFFVPASLYAQTVCAGAHVLGQQGRSSLSNYSATITDSTLIRQPDGSLTQCTSRLIRFSLANSIRTIRT